MQVIGVSVQKLAAVFGNTWVMTFKDVGEVVVSWVLLELIADVWRLRLVVVVDEARS